MQLQICLILLWASKKVWFENGQVNTCVGTIYFAGDGTLPMFITYLCGVCAYFAISVCPAKYWP